MENLQVTHAFCKYVRIWTSFVVALALLSSFAAFADVGRGMNSPAATWGRTLSPVGPEPSAGQQPRAAEAFKGEGARLRAQQLRLTNKAIRRAMRDLEKRGLAPKWDQSLTILQAKPRSTASANGGSIQRVSYPQTWSDGSYELTLITYSNGNSQWEGIIYLHNPYEDDTYEALISTPATAPWDTVYEYWYPPDGGDPGCGGGPCVVYGRVNPNASQAPGAKFVKAGYSAATGVLAKPGFWGRIKRWIGCVWNTCGWARELCPDLACFAYYCGNAMLGC